MAEKQPRTTSIPETALPPQIAVSKHFVPHILSTREGGWARQTGVELAGKTLGLLGLGRIGDTDPTIFLALLLHGPFSRLAFPSRQDFHGRFVSAVTPAVAPAVTQVRALCDGGDRGALSPPSSPPPR